MLPHSRQYIAHRRETDGEIQSVEDHLLGVGRIASRLAGKIGMASCGELLGILHDLGKYAEGFQNYFDDTCVGAEKVDHSTAGAQFLWKELSSKGRLSAAVAQSLALCIASHHGGLIDCLTPEGVDRFGLRMQKDDAQVHLQEVLEKADHCILERCHQIMADPSLVNSFVGMMKAISDRQETIQKVGADARFRLMIGFMLRMHFSCLIDADRTDTADFEKPGAANLRARGEYTGWDSLIQALESHLRKFKHRDPIDHIRNRISDECLKASQRAKGIFSLTVPTGGGKTLASLRFALHHASKWKHERIIYVLPYTTIIDQNAGDVRQIFEPHGTPGDFASIVLEHHSNLTPEEETPKSKLLSENWDAPVIYTTMVQFLESVFSAGTRGVRRMHQLANAVIVFDEIQTLPVKTCHLFCNAINFLVDHCGSTALLCTATQPLLDQVDKTKGALNLANGSEIVSDISALFNELKRVDIVDHRKVEGWTDDELATLTLDSLRDSGSCLVIVNTKKAARSLFDILKIRQPTVTICHLSTNMCPAHRLDVLDRIWKRLGKKGKPPEEPGPIICISTQLIEAGIDVDFGTVIRFAAGLDSIAQAAGRCNRHGRRKPGKVFIVNPVDDNLHRLEDIRVGRDATIRVLGEFAEAPGSFGDDLLSPKAIERYFRYYFFERRHLMDYPIVEPRDDTLLALLSENSNSVAEFKRRNSKAPEHFWRQSFMTAGKAFKPIDAPTQGVVVPYEKEGTRLIGDMCATVDARALFSMVRKAQRYSVNVFPEVLDRLAKNQAVYEVQPGTGILHLDPAYYSPDFGLSLDAVAEQPFLNA